MESLQARSFEYYYNALSCNPNHKNNDIMWYNLGLLLVKNNFDIDNVLKLFPDIGFKLTKEEIICYCFVNSLLFNQNNEQVWLGLTDYLYEYKINVDRFLQLQKCQIVFAEYLICNGPSVLCLAEADGQNYIGLCINCLFQILKIKADENIWFKLGKLYEEQIRNKVRIFIVDFHIFFPFDNYHPCQKIVMRIPFYCYLRALSYRNNLPKVLLKIGLYFYRDFISLNDINLFNTPSIFPAGCNNNKEYAAHYFRKAFEVNNESIFAFITKVIDLEDRHLILKDGLVREEQLNIKLDLIKRNYVNEDLNSDRPLKKRKHD